MLKRKNLGLYLAIGAGAWFAWTQYQKYKAARPLTAIPGTTSTAIGMDKVAVASGSVFSH